VQLPADAIEELEREARELSLYDDADDEVTTNVHVHLPQPSIHDSVPPKKALKNAFVSIGAAAGTALLVGIVALLNKCGH
jgi:hypothetical protein